MGPLPKRRNSRGRAGRRQIHIKQSVKNLVTCPNCGAKKETHRICPECHTYAATDKTEAKKSTAKTPSTAKAK